MKNLTEKLKYVSTNVTNSVPQENVDTQQSPLLLQQNERGDYREPA